MERWREGVVLMEGSLTPDESEEGGFDGDLLGSGEFRGRGVREVCWVGSGYDSWSVGEKEMFRWKGA